MLARVFAFRWCVPLAVLVAAILSASCERRSGIPVGDPGAEDQRAEPTGPDADYLALGEIRRCSALPHRGQPEFARLFDPPRPWLGDHEDPLDAVVEGFRRLSALATAVDAYGRCKATGETYDVMVMMLEVAATVAPSWHRYVTGLTRDDPDRVASEAEAEQLVDGIAAIVSSLPFMAKDPHVYMAMPSEPLVRRLGVALRELVAVFPERLGPPVASIRRAAGRERDPLARKYLIDLVAVIDGPADAAASADTAAGAPAP